MADDKKNISYSFSIKDNTELVDAQLKKATAQALMLMGVNAVRYVTEYMSIPDFTGRDIVDTGRLRGSISFSTAIFQSGLNAQATADSLATDALVGTPSTANTVIVGTNVDYAQAVELGHMTKKGTIVAGRYFLKNGIEQSLPETEEGVKAILKGEKL